MLAMRKSIKFLLVLVVFLFFLNGCIEDLVSNSAYVRFRNDSATKTVMAVWDGVSMGGNLAPGEITEYYEQNPGTHTLVWKRASDGKALTSMGYPSLVSGKYYTYPYSD